MKQVKVTLLAALLVIKKWGEKYYIVEYGDGSENTGRTEAVDHLVFVEFCAQDVCKKN